MGLPTTDCDYHGVPPIYFIKIGTKLFFAAFIKIFLKKEKKWEMEREKMVEEEREIIDENNEKEELCFDEIFQ